MFKATVSNFKALLEMALPPHAPVSCLSSVYSFFLFFHFSTSDNVHSSASFLVSSFASGFQLSFLRLQELISRSSDSVGLWVSQTA